MKGVGGTLIALGVLLLIIAVFMDPTISTPRISYTTDFGAPDRVVNLQKLQIQMMLWHGGIGAFLAGTIFLSVGLLLGRLEESGVVTPRPEAPVAAPIDGAACAWCDRGMPYGRLPCSEVDAERLRSISAQIGSETCQQQLKEHGLLG